MDQHSLKELTTNGLISNDRTGTTSTIRMSSNDILENPAELLREVRESFIIDQDIESLLNIDGKMEQIRARSQDKLRDKKTEISRLEMQLRASESRVQSLSQDLNQIKGESQDLVGQSDVVDFVKELDTLEQSIVDLRSDLDVRVTKFVEGNRATSSDEPLFDQQVSSEKALDKQGQSEMLLDPEAKANLLKLKLYRSLLIFIDDVNNQVMIEGNENEINTLPLDDDLSDFFRTKYIWDRMRASR